MKNFRLTMILKMMLAKFIIITSLILISTYGYSAEFCVIKPLAGSKIADRTRAIQFPDGREIVIVGNSHGHPGAMLQLDELVKNPRAINNSVLKKNFSEIVTLESESRQDQKEDYAFLKQILPRRSDIKFVAIEFPADEVSKHVNENRQFQARLASAIAGRNILSTDEFQDIKILRAGAATSFKINESEIFKGRQLVGFDSTTAIREIWDAQKGILDVNKKLGKDVEIIGTKLATDKYIWDQYLNYEPEAQDSEILDYVKRSASPKHQTLFIKWVKAQLLIMKLHKHREKHIIQGVLSQSESGIVFIGNLHLDSMAQQLKKKCNPPKDVSKKSDSLTKKGVR